MRVFLDRSRGLVQLVGSRGHVGRSPSIIEEIGMCAGAQEHELSVSRLIDEKPVGLDVALAVAFPHAL